MNASAPDIDLRDGTCFSRTLTFQGQPQAILAAWCDLAVQSRLFEGAATPVEVDERGTLWQVRLPLGRQTLAWQRLMEKDADHALHAIEGDDGWAAMARLSCAPARARSGIEVTLTLQYATEGVVAAVLKQLLDPAPSLLAGEVLRRLRAYIEAGEVPSLAPLPAHR